MTSCFRSTTCISILLCKSSIEADRVSYRAWTQWRETLSLKLTCEWHSWKAAWWSIRVRGGCTWAFSVSLLQTSLRLWILAFSCCVSLEISWILSAISSRFWWIWLHCLENRKIRILKLWVDKVIKKKKKRVEINTPKHLERAAPSSLSSSVCGCSVWTLCPASCPELALADLPHYTGSSAPSASSHIESSAPGAAHTQTHRKIKAESLCKKTSCKCFHFRLNSIWSLDKGEFKNSSSAVKVRIRISSVLFKPKPIS